MLTERGAKPSFPIFLLCQKKNFGQRGHGRFGQGVNTPLFSQTGTDVLPRRDEGSDKPSATGMGRFNVTPSQYFVYYYQYTSPKQSIELEIKLFKNMKSKIRKIFNWILSYLQDRDHITKFQGKVSEILK